VNSDGAEINRPNEIEKEIVSFYKELYENYDKSSLRQNDDRTFFDNISGISGEEAEAVVNCITKDQLRQTLATCKDSRRAIAMEFT